jgi:hypothetical protein
MKVLVKASHKVLPPVNKEVDSDELSDVVGALIHFGYDVDNETLDAEAKTVDGYLNMNDFDAEYEAECYYAEQERSIPNMRVEHEFEATREYPHPSYCRYK